MSSKKPNLFVRPFTGSNLALSLPETLEKELKGDNCFVVPLQTPMNFWQKYKDKICGFAIPLERPNPIVVQNPVSQDLDNGTFVIYDLETTGLWNEYDHITEIGALKVTLKNGKVVKKEEFQQFVKQDKPLKPFISKLTHITDEMLNKQGIAEDKAIAKFMEFCGDAPCIGHNIINFDARFINKKCAQYGLKPYNNAQIDTVEVSKLFNKRPNHTLRSMAQDLKITYDPKYQHRAIADVIVNWEVFRQTCIPAFKEHGITNVDQINDLMKDNYYYYSQQKHQQIIIFPSPKVKNKILALSVQNKLNVENLSKYGDEYISTNNPSSGVILDLALNDSDKALEDKISVFNFISLPPVSFWSTILSSKSQMRYLNLNDANDRLIFENKKELEKCLEFCNTDNDKVKALGKSPIFKNLSLNQSNLWLVLSKISFATNELCEEKVDKKTNKVYYTLRQDPALTLKELQKAYIKIIDICKKQNIPLVIDNEIYIASKEQEEELNDTLSNAFDNPYKKFMSTDAGCKLYKFSDKELEKEFAFLNNPKLFEEICYENPKKIFKQIKEKVLGKNISK